MAIFSGKILSTKFLNYPKNTLIEVLYTEDDSIITYVLEVDFEHNDFNDLIKEVSLEKIEKNTEAIIKAELSELETIVNDEVKRRLEQENQNVTAGILINTINDKNDDQDFVFTVKVAILDDQEIAGTKDKNLKLAIRKAKTIKELLKIYIDIKG